MDEFIRRFFEAYSQLYLLHWQTKKYGRHIAFDEVNEELEDLVDRFVEAYMGKKGERVKLVGDIVVKNIDELNLGQFINGYISFLVNDIPQLASDKDVDLLAIRDEMVALLHKLKYLLTLD